MLTTKAVSGILPFDSVEPTVTCSPLGAVSVRDVGAGLVVMGDDASAAADTAWGWIDSQVWAQWRVDVVTARVPPIGPPLGEGAALPRQWEPPRPRRARREADLAEVRHLVADADPRLVLGSRDDADLLVVGPRGHGLLKRLHLGSTAEYLLHHPPAPLVVARRATPVRRALIAVDGSPHAHRAVQAFTSLPWVTACESVTVLGVREDGAPVERGVRDAVETLAASGVSPDRLDRDGSVADAVMDAVSSFAADLVVLGTRGSTGLPLLFVGSTAGAVVRGADCSVLVASDVDQP